VAGGFGCCCTGAGVALGAAGVAVGVGRADKMATCLVSSLTVLVRVWICFCVSSSRFLMSWRPGILTVVDWLEIWCFISSRTNWHMGPNTVSMRHLVCWLWWVADFQVKKLARVSVLWSHSGA